MLSLLFLLLPTAAAAVTVADDCVFIIVQIR